MHCAIQPLFNYIIVDIGPDCFKILLLIYFCMHCAIQPVLISKDGCRNDDDDTVSDFCV